MGQFALEIYTLISVLVLITDIILMVKSFRKNENIGKNLGNLCAGSIAVIVFYLWSAASVEFISFKIASSMYFISMDILMLFLLSFAYRYTHKDVKKKDIIFLSAFHAFFVVEVIIFIVNIFNEFAIGYIKAENSKYIYDYDMHFAYFIHLVYDYLILLISLFMLIRKMIKLPKEYKKPYYYILAGILVVTIINALYLFAPSTHLWNDLDYSIWGYSVVEYFMYWTCFRYSKLNMPIIFRNAIVDTIDQGIVMFDIDDKMVLSNRKAVSILPQTSLYEGCKKSEFCASCGIDTRGKENYANYVMQVLVEKDGIVKTFRCDYHNLVNKKQNFLGSIFSFSETVTGVDLLTGFHTMESFDHIARERKEQFQWESAVLIMDIIGLKHINYNEGRNAGDDRIRELAKCMKKVLPADTFFVRGQDANLIAICRFMTEEQIKGCVETIKDGYGDKLQYAVGMSRDADAVTDTIISVEKSLRARKLMDKQSHHSEVLTSLLVALQECDPDTEKHVERTQQMGDALGKRVGLSEVDLSDLSLLCILHDIGKIGIPMDILNKPTKLNDSEWVIMKSHVEKGYQIAASNQEFAGIASMIRAHHERWDGKGYPDGLKGNQIPVLSRIISIIDAYDAMVSDRIYRPGMSPEDAQAELKRCAGTQFDPYLVEEMLKMLEEPEFKAKSEAQKEKIRIRKYRDQERESKKRELIESVVKENDYICLKDYIRIEMLNDGRIININSTGAKVLGYTQNEFDNNSLYLSHLMFDEDKGAYIKTISSQFRKEGFEYFQTVLKNRNNEALLVSATARKYYDSTKKEERAEMVILEYSVLENYKKTLTK